MSTTTSSQSGRNNDVADSVVGVGVDVNLNVDVKDVNVDVDDGS